MRTWNYADFEKPEVCDSSCHIDFYQQWKQAMMSQAYTHHWDEIEYFKLALPTLKNIQKLPGVNAGCNGCNSPIVFLTSDVSTPKPEANSHNGKY